MRKTLPLPPLERLNELFKVVSIHPSQFGVQSGLIRKVSRGGQRAGSRAGYLVRRKIDNRLVWNVRIDDRQYLVSRIIYFMVNGVDPGELEVDHDDRNPVNNNIQNLRLADSLIQANNRGIYANNKSGIIGVSWDRKRRKWLVQLMHKGKKTFLGYYICKVKAAHAYNQKIIELELNKRGKVMNTIENIKCSCCK